MGHSLFLAVLLAANAYGSSPVLRMHLTGAIDPEVSRIAGAFLPVLAMGEEAVQEVNGRLYAFRAEPHYHPPGHPGPNGWHKGITAYAVEAPLESVAAR